MQEQEVSENKPEGLIGPMPMSHKVFKTKRGVEYKLVQEYKEPSANSYGTSRIKYIHHMKRHGAEVNISWYSDMSSFYVRQKLKRQKFERSNGSHQDFDLILNHVERIFNSQHKKEVREAEQRVKNKSSTQAFLATLTPGMIMSSSWGYSMSIVDYYKIVSIKGSTVKLIKLANKAAEDQSGKNSWQHGNYVIPDTEVQVGEPIEQIVRSTVIKLKSNSSSRITPWDGTPKYENRND